jgi:tryptophanyl-tRNA synthetase
VCTIYQYLLYLFEEDDAKLATRLRECKAGNTVCGDCKALLTERVGKFLVNHQQKREKAKDVLEDFFIPH